VAFAKSYGASTLVLDSLKDLALNLSEDGAGLRINNAIQSCLAAGIAVLILHHHRKEHQGGQKPDKLADVYGSTWIVNGAGSVIVLWGEAGDPVVELKHLKPVKEPIGPLEVVHDHATGRSRVEAKPDAWTILQGARNGLTALTLACIMTGEKEPDKAEQMRAYRKLERFAKEGSAHKKEAEKGGASGGSKGSKPAIYYAITAREEQA
jgi:replicative DNA helicase